jgi:hypothetical protein
MFNFLPGSGIFALAGAIAAAGPILIHLLNRRRFRVVNWAAMDFLIEALARNRRILQLRDLLLLALRTACVLLFGLALARPFLSQSSAVTSTNEPLHAVLVIDNSLSMGYSQLDRTLLDDAKSKAKEFLEDLPGGSRISVLPLCGSAGSFSLDAYRSKEDARDALDQIEVVDRAGSAAGAADLARQALAQVPDMPGKRIAFIGDQQLVNWPQASLSEQLKDLPELQVVSVAPADLENTWISDFSVVDGIADVETPALFSVTIRHEGPSPRTNVQVTLSIDGTEVGSETVDLENDQSREVLFKYRFDVAVEPGKSLFVPAKVSIPPDRLKADDYRVLAVPVVAALPVVFVDQYGADEDPKRNRYGETLPLRQLLAPVTERGETNRQLVKIRHLKIDELDRSKLEDARLVVIAGIPSPEGSVDVLRDYVEQGGQLVIAAGAAFNPAAWNELAWRDGTGILPVALKSELVGKMPEETTGELKPFFLSYPSMAHDYFHLSETSEDDLKDLYGRPLFFKAVEADSSDAAVDVAVKSEERRIAEARQFLAGAEAKLKAWSEQEARGQLSESDRQARAEVEDRRQTVQPDWLLWPERRLENDAGAKSSELAERTRPRVLAQYDSNLPFLVERSLGRGQVLLITTGMYSNWNTLVKNDTIVIYDRLLRGMLARTLPNRNLSSVEQVRLPVLDRNGMFTLKRPDAAESAPPEVLPVDALGADLYGVAVDNLTARGIYTVTAVKGDVSAEHEAAPAKLWEVNLAVNGPSRESEPAVIDAIGLKDIMGDANYRWIGPGERISLEGAQVRFQDLWKWLIFLVLAGLLLEMFILARPVLAKERAA